MRIPVLGFASVVAVLASTQLAAATDIESFPGGGTKSPQIARQCLRDLQEFDTMLARVGFGILPPAGYGAPATASPGGDGAPRLKIRALREAATVEALRGDDRACRALLASMQAVFEEHQKVLGPETAELETTMTWRRAHLAQALPVAKMSRLMRADIVIGSDIRNLQDQRLGTIRDIVLDPGKSEIAYMLVARNGIWGLTDKMAAVPWNRLRATEDHQLFVLDVAPSFLEQAPTVDRRNFAATADAQWQRAMTLYWNDSKPADP